MQDTYSLKEAEHKIDDNQRHDESGLPNHSGRISPPVNFQSISENHIVVRHRPSMARREYKELLDSSLTSEFVIDAMLQVIFWPIPICCKTSLISLQIQNVYELE